MNNLVWNSKIDLSELQKAVNEKLVQKKSHPFLDLYLYRYHNRVFFNGLWDQNSMIRKSRGLVLNELGDIICWPFNKVYNYKEMDAGCEWNDKDRVLAVNKANGFLANVFLYNDNVHVSTTGTFDSEYAQYACECIGNHRLNLIKDLLESSNIMNLMFEVCSWNDDPHIINEGEQVFLIGGRYDYTYGYRMLLEPKLDAINEQLNNLFSRPEYKYTTFGNIKNSMTTIDHEGYMIYNLDQGGTSCSVVKMKSPLYLVTKFFSRGKKNLDIWNDNLDIFKQKAPEEFYPLAEWLKEHYSREEWETMDQMDKVHIVREQLEKYVRN